MPQNSKYSHPRLGLCRVRDGIFSGQPLLPLKRGLVFRQKPYYSTQIHVQRTVITVNMQRFAAASLWRVLYYEVHMEGEHPSARKRGQRVGIPIYFVIEQSSLYARYPTPIKWKSYRKIPIKENRNSCMNRVVNHQNQETTYLHTSYLHLHM